MVMNAKAITRAIRGEQLIYNKQGVEIVSKRGGWSRIRMEHNGKDIVMNLRSTTVREVIRAGRMRYSTVEDRLYSKWIDTTKAGREYTARRQVEGMLKKARKNGMFEMASQLEEVLTHSDAYVARYRAEWESKTSDLEIEEFYEYRVDDLDYLLM